MDQRKLLAEIFCHDASSQGGHHPRSKVGEVARDQGVGRRMHQKGGGQIFVSQQALKSAKTSF